MQRARQLHRIAIAEDMHVVWGRLGPEQMVVQGGDLDAALGQLLHHPIDLIGGSTPVAPPSASFFITGLTSSAVSTRSPITMAVPPWLRNASQLPSAKPGLIATPSTVTCRSVRGSPTR